MRLIDADELKKIIREKRAKAINPFRQVLAAIEILIDQQPTIDAECIGCKEDCEDIALCRKNPYREDKKNNDR